MTKAKTKSITLDVRSETKKGDAPKTEIQKMAAEIGRLDFIFNELERIEWAATNQQGEKKDKFDDLGSLGRDAERLCLESGARNTRLKEAILHAEPVDSIDALIMMLVFAAEEGLGNDWVACAIDAKTEKDKSTIRSAYEDDCRNREELLNRILRGLVRGLRVSPDDLGMRSFWNGHSNLDFEAAIADVKSRAVSLNLKIEG